MNKSTTPNYCQVCYRSSLLFTLLYLFLPFTEASNFYKKDVLEKKAFTSVVLNGNDCDQATTICASSDIVFTPSGSGIDDFASPANGQGCIVGGEHFSAWYYFEFNADTPPGSNIEFAISPNNGSDDYDFAIWGPDVNCGALGSPTRCSSSMLGFTGLMDGAGDFTEGPGVGDGFVEDIIVGPGDGFYMLVDNFTQSSSGFTLSWGGSAAPFLDCSAIPPEAECAMSANATSNGDEDLCSGQIVVAFGNAINNAGPVTYAWLASPPSGQGFIESPNSQMTIIAFSPEAEGQYTFTLTVTQEADGCVATSNLMFNVQPGEPPLLDDFDDICDTDDPVGLAQVQDDIFGSWSGEGVDNNTFDPDGQMGSIALIFTPSPGQCASSDTTFINVGSSMPIMLDEIADICETATIIPLSTTQSGSSGNWDGSGVMDNMFNPDGLSGDITLTFTPTLSCGVPASTVVTILEPTSPTLDNFEDLCEQDAPITLPDTQDGLDGVWTIDGVEEMSFDPIGFGGETVTLVFTPTSGDCTDEANTSITVLLAEEVFLEDLEAVCEGDGVVNLSSSQSGFDGTWSGLGVTNNQFNPDGQNGFVDLTFTPDDGQCAEITMTTIEVTTGTMPEIEMFEAVCPEDVPVNLNGTQDGVNGTWSGTNVVANQFDPDGLSGFIDLTFTPDEGQCALVAMTTIEVTDEIMPTLDMFETLCESDNIIFLPNMQGNISGNWSGDGVAANSFNPDGLNGLIEITFTPNVGQCAVAAMTTIEVTNDNTPALDDFQDICATDNPIDLPIEQENVTGTWSGDGVTDNQFNPDGQMGVIDLTFTPDDGQCAEAVMTTIAITNGNMPELENFDALCPENSPISLNPIQDNIMGTWMGSGVTGNQFNPDGLNGIIDLTFTPDDGQCALENMTTIEVTDEVEPVLDVFDPICESDANLLSLPTTQSNVMGTWSGDGVGVNGFNPEGLSGTVQLIFTPAADECAVEVMTSIEVEMPNTVSLSSSNLNTCNNAAQGSVLNFTELLVGDNLNGTWADTDNTTVDLSNPDMVDFDAITPGTYIFTYTEAAINSCPSESVEIEVLVQNCLCPSVATVAPDDLCNEAGMLDLTTLEDDADAGTWSITATPMGDAPAVLNAAMFDATGADAGDYEITFTLNQMLVGCPEASVQILTVTPTTPPTLDDLDDLCDLDVAIALPLLQDDVFGNWSGDGVTDNEFNPATLSGSVELMFNPNSGQCAETATTTINVTTATAVDLDDFGDVCDTDALLNLPTLQDGFTGTWNGTGISNNQFNPDGLTGAIELTFTPDDGQCKLANTTAIQVNTPPSAALSTDMLTICNASAQGSTINFSNLITDGDASGVWTDTDGTGADFSDITAVDFDDVDEGIYTFTYTTNSALTPCSEAVYTISIEVELCNIDCPNVSTAPPTAPLCNEDGMLDLSSLTITTEAGVWIISTTPMGTNPATINGTTFDATNADAGDYTITFTLNNPIDNCPESSSQMIEVEAQPFAVLSDNAANVCNDPENNSLLDLAMLLIEGDVNGTWLDDDGTGVDLSNTTAIDFLGVPVGTYTFTYATNTPNLACPDQVYEVEVLVENCMCPSVALGSQAPLCNSSALIDLEDLQVTGEAGTWSILSTTVSDNVATLAGVTFDATDTDAGTYELQFTLDNPIPNCPSSNTITIEIDEALSAGTAPTPLSFCPEQNEFITLAEQITDEDIGGIWQETSSTSSTNNAFDANNGTFSITNQASGTYSFVYTIGNSDSACPMDESTVIVVIEDEAVADAGLNQQLTCQTTTVSLNGTNSIGNQYQWINTVGDTVGTSANINVETAGTYTLIVSTAAGCTATDVVQVSAAAPPIIAEVTTIEADCIDPTGDIIIGNVNGGTPSFSYSINGGSLSTSPQFSNLEAGAYDIVIQDAAGCFWDTTIVLAAATLPALDLGADQNLFIGETVSINTSTNLSLQDIASIEWSNDSIIICDTLCLNPLAVPSETVLLLATITDINGCTATDDITLFVDRTPQIYAPTGFSPDDDGFNDFFTLFTGYGVKDLQSLQIFNRWGEVVFETNDITENIEAEGWDGTFKGEKLNPSVFVWMAVLELTDGRIERRTGNVTLIR